MSHRVALLLLLLAVAAASVRIAGAAEITAEKSDDGVVVKIDGELFTEYVIDSEGKPILWPVLGPTGKPMTRAYPMARGSNEREDHPHHRSIWFAHGDVNGLSFWHVETIKHRQFVKIESGPRAVIVTRNDWLGPDGKKQCEDQRTLTFGTDDNARWIDYDINITTADRPVKFGDTKEGTMAIRVAATMKVDAKLGGRIINSEGQTDKDAWGTRAAWVDYHGPVDGRTVGVAMLNHPSSYEFPTYWHVRTYGLFAANPFGLHDFTKSDDLDGSVTLGPNSSIALRYRLLFHVGNEKAGKVAEAFRAYAEETK